MVFPQTTLLNRVLLFAVLTLAAYWIAAGSQAAVASASGSTATPNAFVAGWADGDDGESGDAGDGVCDDFWVFDDPDCRGDGDGGGDGGDDGGGGGDDGCDQPVSDGEWGDESCDSPGDGDDSWEEEGWPETPDGIVATLIEGTRKVSVPEGVPPRVAKMIRAANSLTSKPFKKGGGNKRWKDRGYDDVGAIGFVLHGAGLLKRPPTRARIASFGVRGAGDWVQIYTKKKQAFMVIAGLRFDTAPFGSSGSKGPRWRETLRSTEGFKLRHPAGL